MQYAHQSRSFFVKLFFIISIIFCWLLLKGCFAQPLQSGYYIIEETGADFSLMAEARAFLSTEERSDIKRYIKKTITREKQQNYYYYDAEKNTLTLFSDDVAYTNSLQEGSFGKKFISATASPAYFEPYAKNSSALFYERSPKILWKGRLKVFFSLFSDSLYTMSHSWCDTETHAVATRSAVERLIKKQNGDKYFRQAVWKDGKTIISGQTSPTFFLKNSAQSFSLSSTFSECWIEGSVRLRCTFVPKSDSRIAKIQREQLARKKDYLAFLAKTASIVRPDTSDASVLGFVSKRSHFSIRLPFNRTYLSTDRYMERWRKFWNFDKLFVNTFATCNNYHYMRISTVPGKQDAIVLQRIISNLLTHEDEVLFREKNGIIFHSAREGETVGVYFYYNPKSESYVVARVSAPRNSYLQDFAKYYAIIRTIDPQVRGGISDRSIVLKAVSLTDAEFAVQFPEKAKNMNIRRQFKKCIQSATTFKGIISEKRNKFRKGYASGFIFTKIHIGKFSPHDFVSSLKKDNWNIIHTEGTGFLLQHASNPKIFNFAYYFPDGILTYTLYPRQSDSENPTLDVVDCFRELRSLSLKGTNTYSKEFYQQHTAKYDIDSIKDNYAIIRVSKTDKKGLLRKDGTITIPPKYEGVFFEEPYVQLVKDKRIGLATLEGEVLLKCKYYYWEHEYFSNNMLYLYKHGESGTEIGLYDLAAKKLIIPCSNFKTITYNPALKVAIVRTGEIKNGESVYLVYDISGKMIQERIGDDVRILWHKKSYNLSRKEVGLPLGG